MAETKGDSPILAHACVRPNSPPGRVIPQSRPRSPRLPPLYCVPNGHAIIWPGAALVSLTRAPGSIATPLSVRDRTLCVSVLNTAKFLYTSKTSVLRLAGVCAAVDDKSTMYD